MSEYVYQPAAKLTDWPAAVQALRDAGRTVVEGAVDASSPGKVERILAAAGQAGVPFTDWRADEADYRDYFARAGYRGKYAGYYAGNQAEKSFEHFVSLRLLDVREDDVFVDLASESSPVPQIYRALARCAAYRQDIMYPPGVLGDRIGGDAAAMPVADGFFTKAALTCSLEHFEGDADSRLFRELVRVLRPGGKVCVAPFYCNDTEVAQTDPLLSVPAGVTFDEGVPVHCAPGWGNRHGRFYSPSSFRRRIVDAVGDRMRFDFVHVANATAIDASIYLRFAVVGTRLG